MLDRALRLTLRDLSTYLLIVACVTVTLHAIHAFLFRRAIAVSELHAAIETFPGERQVKGVGTSELSAYRLTGWLLVAIEILALPLLVGAARRVLAVRADGGLPTVSDAWRYAGRGTSGALSGLRNPGLWVPAAVLAVVIATLAERAGLIAVEPLGDRAMWVGDALVRGLARALGGAFLVTPLALTARTKEPWSQMPTH